MLNDPLDRPGRHLDPITETMMERLNVNLRSFRNPVTLREKLRKQLTRKEAIAAWLAARAYPVPPVIQRLYPDLDWLQLAVFRVSYAIANRALVRWGPLYENRNSDSDYYLGRHQITPEERQHLGALADWVDLWRDSRGLRVNYLGGHIYVLSDQPFTRIGQCPSALAIAGERAGFMSGFEGRDYSHELVTSHPTEGPVMRTALDWMALHGEAVNVQAWSDHPKFGLRPVAAPVSEAEFWARQLPLAA